MTIDVHPNAICESDAVGSGTRISAFSHVLPGARVGQDCTILDHVFIDHDVVIGNGVTIRSGVQIASGVRIEDDVFIGANTTFGENAGRSGGRAAGCVETVIQRGAWIGVGATLLPGVTVGEDAAVEPGAGRHSVRARTCDRARQSRRNRRLR